jgi:hypothetical protein
MISMRFRTSCQSCRFASACRLWNWDAELRAKKAKCTNADLEDQEEQDEEQSTDDADGVQQREISM